MDWENWRKTVAQTIANKNEWIGLCDGWGKPIMEIPQIITMTAPKIRFSPGALDLKLATTAPGGYVHHIVDLMVADNLGVFDENGQMVVKEDVVDMVVIDNGTTRTALTVSYPTVSGKEAPTEMSIKGVELLDRLSVWPCPSVPASWTSDVQVWKGDVVEYKTPRELRLFEMATVADGYTMHGPAEATIKKLIQDSFDAVNTQWGWEDSAHLVVDMAPTGVESPEVFIRVQDGMVAETVFPVAQIAGVNISIDLWWPGDDPVLVRTADRESVELREWDRAIGVVRVEQI